MDTEEKATNQIEETDQTEKEKTILEKATEWYNDLINLPKILFISIIVVCFIWGIIDPSVFVYADRWASYYGIMHMESGFLCWFIWQIIGLVAGGIAYYFAKLSTSYKILQTEYLKKISEKE